MSDKYTIILILTCFSALLLVSLEFNSIKGKIKRFVILLIFLCISISTVVSYKNYLNESIEKKKQQLLENSRFERNIYRLDSITKISNIEYLKIKDQERINNLHHKENITRLLDVINGLNHIVIDNKKQSSAEQNFFVNNFDSLTKVTNNLKIITQKVEMENYPLVPITFWLSVHFKYRTKIFDKSLAWKSDTSWMKWFDFYNKTSVIDYYSIDFPKFSSQDSAMRDFIRNFKLSINIKNDTTTCFIYPKMEGTFVQIKNGGICFNSNLYDDYSLSVFNSNIDKELLVYLRYEIPKLRDDFENLCNYKSISDFKDKQIEVIYEIVNPLTQNIILENNVNKSDTEEYKIVTKKKRVRGKEFEAFKKEILSDTNYHVKEPIKMGFHEVTTITLHEVLRSHNVKEKLNLDFSDIYLDSLITVSYGKNLSEKKSYYLCAKDHFSHDRGWFKCSGRYIIR